MRSVKLACVAVLVLSVTATGVRAAATAAPTSAPAAPLGVVTEQIVVDQFGWRPKDARKVAIFADPIKGQNAAHRYTPGPTFQVRRVSDGTVALSGKIVPWNNGQVQSLSGDKVWWGDFSNLSTPGEYYIYDPARKLRSYPFKIGEGIYNDVLKAAVRTYYYQRCGVALEAKCAGNWVHPPCHVGKDQQRTCRPINAAAGKQPRDLSGGWHDAGDYNKYVPYLADTLWDLMTAYEWHSDVFADDWGIPESDNGVPDLLDDVKWELDWLLKMQLPDGSVTNRVCSLSYEQGDGPAEDRQPQVYTQPTTWATANLAAHMAQAARIFKGFEETYPGYTKKLQAAADKAWAYLEAHPTMLPADGKDTSAGTAATPASSDVNTDQRLRVLAAAQLFKTTGQAKYRQYFDAHYADKAQMVGRDMHPLDGLDATRNGELVRAMVTYATTKGATSTVVQRIKDAVRKSVDETILANYTSGADAYRAWMFDGHYCWGSNSVKSKWGDLLLYAVHLNVSPQNNARYREAAEEYLHYFHGRNPLSYVYLTNMGDKGAKLGASKSAMSMYHGWFHDKSSKYDGPKSRFGPAPGYLVGGPNQFYSVNWVSPPHGEPPMKAFKAWAGAWNSQKNGQEASYEVTEPAIYYQAAYIMLLSHFCDATEGRAGE